MDIAKKLKILAEKGDSLAAYYLGKYYYKENNDIDRAIYWLMRSSYGSCNSAAPVLSKLTQRYPDKIRDAKKELHRERKC